MTYRPTFLALLAVAASTLAACDSTSLNWTPAEAPKALRVDTSRSVYTVSFLPGAVDLGPAEAGRLAAFVAVGGVQPADRISIGAAGANPDLDEARRNHVAAQLRRHGVGAAVFALPVADGTPDRVTVAIERSVVTLPDCPNWSKPPIDNTGAVSSNFGCANVTNLGLMVADAADLAGGKQLSSADPTEAAAAIEIYHTYQAHGAPPPITPTSGNTPVLWPGTIGTAGGGTVK